MSIIMYFIIFVGCVFIIHDLGFLGYYGRKIQNWMFNGPVQDDVDRDVMRFIVDYQEKKHGNIKVHVYERKYDTYPPKPTKEFMIFSNNDKRHYENGEDVCIFDVTGTPETNPEYGNRYERWHPSSPTFEMDICGELNISCETKDRIHELKNSLTEKEKVFDKPKPRRFGIKEEYL